MRDLVVLLIHFIASLARLLGPGGARSLVAESLLLKFHFGCCTLGTFATETTGKLALIICVDVGVVLSPRNGYVREAVVDQQLAFLGVHVDQHPIRGLPLAAVAGYCVTIVKVRVLEKLIPNQLVLPLTART